MTAEELGAKFADVIRQQDWFASLANVSEEADESDVAVAAISGLLGLVIVARAMERLAFLHRLDIDDAMSAVPKQIALLARVRSLEKAQSIAHLIIQAGADRTFDIADSTKTVQ